MCKFGIKPWLTLVQVFGETIGQTELNQFGYTPEREYARATSPTRHVGRRRAPRPSYCAEREWTPWPVPCIALPPAGRRAAMLHWPLGAAHIATALEPIPRPTVSTTFVNPFPTTRSPIKPMPHLPSHVCLLRRAPLLPPRRASPPLAPGATQPPRHLP
jgi:hypothetical protein